MIQSILQKLGRKALAWVVAVALAIAWKGGAYVFDRITGSSAAEQSASDLADEDEGDEGDEEAGDAADATGSDEGEGAAIRPASVPEASPPQASRMPAVPRSRAPAAQAPAAAPAAPDSPAHGAPVDPQALHFADAAPADRQLLAELQRELRGPLETWVFAWRIGLGTFRLDQLARQGVTEITNEDVEPWDGNAEGEDLRLLHLAIPSPDVTRLVDPHLDLDLSARGAVVLARRWRSPGVALVDLKRRYIHRMLSGGENVRFDGAHWIDRDRFVVMAAERRNARSFEGGPVLYLVDLREEKITRYEGPVGDRAAWEDVRRELERRFRVDRPVLAFG